MPEHETPDQAWEEPVLPGATDQVEASPDTEAEPVSLEESIGVLQQLCERRPTEADIESRNVAGLDSERMQLQAQLYELLYSVQGVGRTDLETEALRAVKEKISQAIGFTTVSGEGDHLTVSEVDEDNLYNRLARAHMSMDDAHLLLRLVAADKS